MRILILGVGGIGGFYGARLAAAGRDVTFLVREPRLQQLSTRGLRLTSPAGDVSIPHVRAVTEATLDGTFDLVLLTCKAQDLESAIAAIRPAVSEETVILPLLNGMGHIATLDEQFGRTGVFGGACYISSTTDPDGTIRHSGSLDRLLFGDRDHPSSPRAAKIAMELTGCGFEAVMSTDIAQAMWEKWSFIAATAGITCLMRCALGDLVAAEAQGLSMQLFGETSAVVAAEGFPVSATLVAQAKLLFNQPGSTFTSSMLRDLEAGKQLEIQAIIGDLLALGRRRSVPTPLLELVSAHLRCYDERRKREHRS